MRSYKNTMQQFITVKTIIQPISITLKIKTTQYLEQGYYPIIDQGKTFIGGYTNDKTGLITQLPAIVFGDHTRAFKYVDFPFVAGADGVKVFQAKSCFLPKLLFYFLQAITLPDRGYARHYQYLVKSKIPVPPMAEQKRIVKKIAELFGVIDEQVKRLEATQEALVSYRQSILHSLFSSAIGEKVPLEKCLNYLQPTPYIVKSTDYMEAGEVPVLTPGKTFILGFTKEKEGIFTNPLPVIIFDDFTTSTKLVDFPFKVKSSAMKILLAKEGVDIRYIYYIMQILSCPHDTHKRYWISIYAKMRIILPSLPEQKAIVKKIENAFAFADKAQATITGALEQAKQLKQSILKRAFEGKLVPQDPNDEPVDLSKIKKHKGKSK